MGPSGSTRYLGVQFGAGEIGKVPAEQGKCDTTCLVGSALKPKQKIEFIQFIQKIEFNQKNEFIQSFILPKWRHGFSAVALQLRPPPQSFRQNDGAEVYELVGFFLLDELVELSGKENVGLYRADGLAIINGSGPFAERTKKKILKLFQNHNL